MHLSVFPTWQMVEPEKCQDSTAIVIDVLRASNTIITALANGAQEIIPVPEIETAWEAKKKYPHYLLGGERGSQKIPGFDLGNSPFEYTPERVKGRGIIFSTSNGSRALNVASSASKVYVASLANGNAVLTQLYLEETIVIVCAGTLGTPSLEDSLAAGLLIQGLLEHSPDYQLNDFACLCLSAYEYYKGNPAKALGQSKNGQKLKQLAMERDIGYCSILNRFNIIPSFKEGSLTPI